MTLDEIRINRITIVIERDNHIHSHLVCFPKSIRADPCVLTGKNPFIVTKVLVNIAPVKW